MEKVLLNILKNEVRPAVGCTEPVAVALACAKAAAGHEGEPVERVLVRMSPNIYKNALGVGLPNMKERGLEYAAAAGVCCSEHAHTGLKVLQGMTEKQAEAAAKLAESGKVFIEIANVSDKVFIEATYWSPLTVTMVTIREYHDHIESVISNGMVVEAYESRIATASTDAAFFDMKISEIVNTVDRMSYEDLKFLFEGIEMNRKAAELGLGQPLGLGVGYSTGQEAANSYASENLMDIAVKSMTLTAAASDARMSGMNIQVMTSNGSGNNGLTAILPIVAYTDAKKTDKEKTVKALAISHLINCYIKNRIGRLSPVCSCAISAASGSGAAIAWLETGEIKVIEGAISNMIANLSGLVCDGAKDGCAIKLSTAAYTAVISVILAKTGSIAGRGNGILDNTVEKSIKNLGILSNEGMSTTDKVIIEIMQSMK